MAAILMAVHLPDNNGLPADDTINTFVFQDTNVATTPLVLAEAVVPFMGEFYNTTYAPNDRPLASLLSPSIDRGANRCHMTAYQLAAAGSTIPVTPLGGPVQTGTFTMLAATAGSDLPREVAAVLSLQAPHVGIAEDVPAGPVGPKGDSHPAARHRGRIYLGPLNLSALGAGANGPGLAAAMRTTACVAGNGLLESTTGLAGGTTSWCVWSRANHALYPITSGWMDDAFDTQRRRGIKSTARTFFP